MNASTDSIWSQLSADLRRFIRRRVSDEHVADDLLQETFVRIHGHLDSLSHADQLTAWVYQIARNVIHDHYRRSVGGAVPLGEADPVDEPEDPLSHLRCRSAAWLDELIAQLPEGYRTAVRLAEIEGLPQQEIADRLGLSLSGAKSRIQRGRRMLKNVLEECCRFEFDRRGNLFEVEPRPDRTGPSAAIANPSARRVPPAHPAGMARSARPTQSAQSVQSGHFRQTLNFAGPGGRFPSLHGRPLVWLCPSGTWGRWRGIVVVRILPSPLQESPLRGQEDTSHENDGTEVDPRQESHLHQEESIHPPTPAARHDQP